LAALFGVLAAGAVPAPLAPPQRLGRAEEYRRAAARALVASRAVLVLAQESARPLLAACGAGCPVRALGELPVAEPAMAAVSPEDLALVQFSSGTTADPKPIALTH